MAARGLRGELLRRASFARAICSGEVGRGIGGGNATDGMSCSARLGGAASRASGAGALTGVGSCAAAAAAFGADLVAYYAFDEGSGFDLKEAVSGQLDGKVLYEAEDQTVTYSQPNWQTDERFGTVISCGSATTLQKDTIELADVDYGKNGKFAINVWFRHDKENLSLIHI